MNASNRAPQGACNVDVPLPSNWGGPKNNAHMPFPGHRNQREVREDETAQAIRRGLGK
jgi:hypothetical protein